MVKIIIHVYRIKLIESKVHQLSTKTMSIIILCTPIKV